MSEFKNIGKWVKWKIVREYILAMPLGTFDDDPGGPWIGPGRKMEDSRMTEPSNPYSEAERARELQEAYQRGYHAGYVDTVKMIDKATKALKQRWS